MEENETAYDPFKNQIRRQFPQLPLRSFRMYGEGVRNRVFLVNEEWIFRFPKDVVGAAEMEKEIRVLPVLSKAISISIPTLTYVGKQENGWPFVGYSMLKGETAAEVGFKNLGKKENRQLEEAVSDFISEMRLFPIDLAVEKSVSQRDFFEHYQALERKLYQSAYPYLPKQLQQFLQSQFSWYLKNEVHFQYSPCLLHADLSLDHLLLDKDTHELTGVIDFGDMLLGDPAYEFVYLLEECGAEFVFNVMKKCGERNPVQQMKKATFFMITDAALYFLEGVETENHEQMKEAVIILMKANRHSTDFKGKEKEEESE